MVNTIFSTDRLRCSYISLYGALSPNLFIPIETPLFQICGHYHPKVKIVHRGKTIFKTSFVHNEKIFILPSFGILTGGLDIHSKQISDVLGKKNLSIYPVGQDKVYKL